MRQLRLRKSEGIKPLKKARRVLDRPVGRDSEKALGTPRATYPRVSSSLHRGSHPPPTHPTKSAIKYISNPYPKKVPFFQDPDP